MNCTAAFYARMKCEIWIGTQAACSRPGGNGRRKSGLGLPPRENRSLSITIISSGGGLLGPPVGSRWAQFALLRLARQVDGPGQGSCGRGEEDIQHDMYPALIGNEPDPRPALTLRGKAGGLGAIRFRPGSSVIRTMAPTGLQGRPGS